MVTLCKVALTTSKYGAAIAGALMLLIWKIVLQLCGLSAPASAKNDNEGPTL